MLVAVVGSSALRIWNLTRPALQLDGDQAVTGMMVRRMLDGDNFYVFVAGQRYNGALEQWVQVAVYKLTGLPQNAFTLRLPEVAWMAVATWLVYVVGRRILTEPWRAAVAAVLFSVAPYFNFWKGNHSDGAYPSLVVIGLVGLYAALRISERPSRVQAAVLGVCSGLLLWLGQSGVWLLLPAVLVVAPTFVRSWSLWPPAVVGAVVGAAPTLAWSVKHRILAPVDIGLQTVPTTLDQRFHNVFGPLLREFVGVAGDNGVPGWPYWLQHVTVVVLALGLVGAFVRRRHGLLGVVTLARGGARRPVDALLVTVPVVAAVYVFSKSAWDISNPHYLFTYTPVYVLLLVAALPRRRTAALVAANVAGVVFVATSLTFVVNRAPIAPGTSDADLRATIDYLRAHGMTRAYGDFWTGFPLMYLAGGDLDVAPITAARGKFPDVTNAVDTSTSFVYLDSLRHDIGGVPFPRPAVEQALRAHGVTFTATRIGTVTVFSDLSRPLRPWELGLARPPA